jgi:hypothetical protein
MSLPLRENATSSTARTAGIAAALVFAVQFVQSILGAVIGVSGNIVYEGFGQSSLFTPLRYLLTDLGRTGVPFALGVFLALWCVVPLGAKLTVPQVLLRSLVASAVAALVTLVVTTVLALGGLFTSAGPLFGSAFPFGRVSDIGYAVFGTLQSVVYSFISLTPLVILAGLLTWLWMSRQATAAPMA